MHENLTMVSYLRIFGLAILAFLFAWQSHYYLFMFSATLPPWEIALESSKSLGYTDQRYEFLFFLVTFYIPYAILSGLTTLVISRAGYYWIAPTAYAVALYLVSGTNFYSWGATTLSIITMATTVTVALICRKHLTSGFNSHKKRGWDVLRWRSGRR